MLSLLDFDDKSVVMRGCYLHFTDEEIYSEFKQLVQSPL